MSAYLRCWRQAGLLVAAWALLAAPAAGDDLRSTEILKYSCGSEFARREITLFANGTVRLREGPWDNLKVYLDELGPAALQENLRLFRSVYSDREFDQIRQPLERSPSGQWNERCEIRLELPEQEREPMVYRFSSYDIPPLRINRLIHIAEELALNVRSNEREEGLPEGYQPQFGDILRTKDGISFQVLRLTSDRNGVELQGVDQPVRIYVPLAELDEVFATLEREHDPAWWWRR